jgi:hypothetical protein
MFALESDYAIGVLSSRAHLEWARSQSSTLEDRIRYTPSSAFETFPWPDADQDVRHVIANAAIAVLQRRSQICAEAEIGLTELYNQVDEGAWADLATLHLALDRAVLAAYGWEDADPADARDINRRLLELNLAVQAGLAPPVTPGP